MRRMGTRGHLPYFTATQTSKYIRKLKKDEKEDSTMTFAMIVQECG